MQKKPFCFLTMILILFAYAGCSRDSRPKDLPRLFPATLTVTLDEQPLADAIVTLYPENEVDARWTVGGWTDSDGKAIIVTHGKFLGSPAGKFKVCITKSEVEGSGPGLKVTHFVDPLFADPKKTPLEIEVSSKGTTDLTLSVYKPQ